MSPSDRSPVDVLVLAGSGVGHYHPVAAFVSRLTTPDRIVIAAALGPNHPARRKVLRDGMGFVEWSADLEHGATTRALTFLRRTLVRRVAPRLAAIGPAAPLPNLASRSTFALASLLRPIEEGRASRGMQLDALLAELRPRLLLTEGHDEWASVLCARHGVTWVRYTTSPVSAPSRRRPTEPAGLDPGLRGAERLTNLVLWSAGCARRALVRRRVTRASTGSDRRGRSYPLFRLAFSSASIDDHSAVPTGWTYVGLSPYRAPDHWWKSAPTSRGRDTILVTWGSGRVAGERELLEKLLPALHDAAPWARIVLRSGDPAVRERVTSSRSTPSHVEVTAPAEDPQYDEYRRCALVVGHGGYGTINEAVAFGSPVLVLPELVADRMETARRVLHARVGSSLDRYNASTESLRSEVERLLADDSVRQSVRVAGAELRDRRNADLVVARLRSELSPRRS